MSCKFSKPQLPNGKLPSTNASYPSYTDYANWTDWNPTDIVDAAVIQDNIAEIVAHVNGGLNGTDIDNTNTPLSETTYIADIETGSVEWPTIGQRHSHDGVDSALLADGVITHALIRTRNYAIVRSPSKTHRGLVLHGTVGHDQDEVYTGSPEYIVAVPYNYRLYNPGTTTLYRNILGGARFVVSRVIDNYDDLSAADKRELAMPYANVTLNGSNVTQFSIIQANILQFSGAEIEAPGVFHWLAQVLI